MLLNVYVYLIIYDEDFIEGGNDLIVQFRSS